MTVKVNITNPQQFALVLAINPNKEGGFDLARRASKFNIMFVMER